MQTENLTTPDSKAVSEIINFSRDCGAKKIALVAGNDAFLKALTYDDIGTDDFTSFLMANPYQEPTLDNLFGKAVLSQQQGIESDLDTLIIVDQENFPGIARQIGSFARKGCLCLPLCGDFVVDPALNSMDRLEKAWKTQSFVNYIARCGLKGHYLEFGTFWGHSFFNNFLLSSEWLEGKFFAFDSFCGLSKPESKEVEFTAGDFTEGAYAWNEHSFRALARLLSLPDNRLEIVPGFYDQTLQSVAPETYGLDPGSVSICYIDCDLLEPTLQVLNFVSDLLEEGALVYFDDWRLCRASPEVGERAAALHWLAKNPSFELIEFDRQSWQHQWFIFQKRS